MATGTLTVGRQKTSQVYWLGLLKILAYVEVLSPASGVFDGQLESAQIQGNEVGGPITVTAMAQDINEALLKF